MREGGDRWRERELVDKVKLRGMGREREGDGGRGREWIGRIVLREREGGGRGRWREGLRERDGGKGERGREREAEGAKDRNDSSCEVWRNSTLLQAKCQVRHKGTVE